ncbi:MAG TPA: hypothetical protein VGU61_21555 [Noviherbaspirillum sp.]|nr:hypothetical protein [Noviherbaspirillum sp.]
MSDAATTKGSASTIYPFKSRHRTCPSKACATDGGSWWATTGALVSWSDPSLNPWINGSTSCLAGSTGDPCVTRQAQSGAIATPGRGLDGGLLQWCGIAAANAAFAFTVRDVAWEVLARGGCSVAGVREHGG